jgi:hypothetical protein
MLSQYRGSWFYDPLRESRYGTFRRSLQMPQDVDERILEVTIQGVAAVTGGAE